VGEPALLWNLPGDLVGTHRLLSGLKNGNMVLEIAYNVHQSQQVLYSENTASHSKFIHIIGTDRYWLV